MSPNQFTLVALLPYIAGITLILAAAGNVTLLAIQVGHYVRTSELRDSGFRVLVSALAANALLYVGLMSITYWPPREWLSTPIHDQWDWIVTWGLGVYLAGAVALVVASGAVAFALIVWSLPKMIANADAWMKARRDSRVTGVPQMPTHVLGNGQGHRL